MKRIVLLWLIVQQAGVSFAQYYPVGTSYNQDFDGLANGLPPGWYVYTAATDTGPGNEDTLLAGTLTWGHSGAGFKNFASANGLASGASTADQHGAGDRALGVRQTTATGYNPGAAFVFRMAHTTGLSDFRLSFNLQALTSSSHVIEWTVDYGLGNTPSVFTAVAATGNLTTGNSTVSNNTVSVDFGSALDHHAGMVWIRIVNLSPSALGSGSRPSTAIDDFSLSWTGTGAGSDRPEVMKLSPANGAQYISLQTAPEITFNRQVQKGISGNLYITDETAVRCDTIPATDPQVVVSGYTVSITGYTWAPASVYHITFDSAAFDTAGYKAYGIYDTNVWRFSTAPEVLTVTSLHETFDEACANNELPPGWARISKKGTQQWSCHTAYGITSYRISAYSGGKYHENEDWLITPRIDMQASDRQLWFKQYKRRAGAEPEVLFSIDYPGYGDPDDAFWTDLQIPMDAADTMAWGLYTADLSSIPAQPFFLAFKYTATATAGYEIRVDSVVIATSQTMVSDVVSSSDAYITGGVAGKDLHLSFAMYHAGMCRIRMYDVSGRCVYQWAAYTVAGLQKHIISRQDFPAGLYMVRLERGKGSGTVLKTIIR